MHVYRKSRHGDEWIYTVGYFQPASLAGIAGGVGPSTYQWVPLEDTSMEEEARQLVNYLNGGNGKKFEYGPKEVA
jgi:hypothetical protein